MASIPNAEGRRSSIEAYWRDGILRDHELHIRRHDGHMLTLEANLDRVEVEGEPCILSMLVDVTQRRRTERELVEHAEEIQRANRALTTVNDELENFAHVVAHDLKEPVRSLHHMLTEARERAVAPGVREAIDAAVKSNDRLVCLLGGLLEVALAARLDAADFRPLHVQDILDSDAFDARANDRCIGISQIRGEISPSQVIGGKRGVGRGSIRRPCTCPG